MEPFYAPCYARGNEGIEIRLSADRGHVSMLETTYYVYNFYRGPCSSSREPELDMGESRALAKR